MGETLFGGELDEKFDTTLISKCETTASSWLALLSTRPETERNSWSGSVQIRLTKLHVISLGLMSAKTKTR